MNNDPVSIIHRECGEEAFKYTGDTSQGSALYPQFVVEAHHDQVLEAMAPIMCRSCGCLEVGVHDLYPKPVE